MGDKWFLKIKCVYCGEENPKPCDDEWWQSDYVLYAPSCGITTFTCDFCGKENKITETHSSEHIKKQVKQ